MLSVPRTAWMPGGVWVGGYGATVRDRGIREQRRLGRPFLYVGLRARVSSWPPLRLAWMRCERESVGVVVPACSPTVDFEMEVSSGAQMFRVGCAPRVRAGPGVGGRAGAPGRPGAGDPGGVPAVRG